MARSRNIKPGFFQNELLAEADPLARLLFAGLWTLADREGRMEDRPKRIKAALLPYDGCDVDGLLNQLAERGFIVRYVVGGIPLILVVNFTKHQNPHCKEAASHLPPPHEHGACIGGDCVEHEGGHADSLNRIPDPLVYPSQEGGMSTTENVYGDAGHSDGANGESDDGSLPF